MSAPPPGIEQTVLNYLRLEFGEDDEDSSALTLADLVYDGTIEVGGETAHYWHFPCGNGVAWVTATPAALGFFMKDPVKVAAETGALDPNRTGKQM